MYTALTSLVALSVGSAFALDGYRDNERMSQTANILAQLGDRINSVGNRVTVLDSNVTSLTHAIITRYPELRVDDDDESN
jgi:hypothetical protein